jgi:hypothetical protein
VWTRPHGTISQKAVIFNILTFLTSTLKMEVACFSKILVYRVQQHGKRQCKVVMTSVMAFSVKYDVHNQFCAIFTVCCQAHQFCVISRHYFHSKVPDSHVWYAEICVLTKVVVIVVITTAYNGFLLDFDDLLLSCQSIYHIPELTSNYTKVITAGFCCS